MSSSAAASTPATIWLGLDVHKESVTIAVLRGDAPTADRVDRLPNDLPKLKRHLERLSGQGPLRAVYEASGAGYVLHPVIDDRHLGDDRSAPKTPRRNAPPTCFLNAADCTNRRSMRASVKGARRRR